MGSSPRVVLAIPDGLARDVVRFVCTRRAIVVDAAVATLGEAVARCSEGTVDVLVCADRFDDEPVDNRLGDIMAMGPRVIVLSADPSPERMTAALSLGAAGYLYYDTAPDEIASGILAVARGAAAIHPTVAGIILQQWRRMRAGPASEAAAKPALTSREAEVLGAMADGLSAKAIARKLGVAVKTVENHKIRIFEKLGARTQAHAVSVAVTHGLLARRPPLAGDSTGEGLPSGPLHPRESGRTYPVEAQ